MSCYDPIWAIRSQRFSRTGKHEIKIIGPVKTCRPDPKEVPLEDHELLLPCNHCIGCRLDYSRRWADRMMLELDHSKKAIFVTLTYNNEHVPMTEISYDGEYLPECGAFTLCKEDLQDFFKRLRKALPGTQIRYFASGEYGSKTDRCHYHAIIFGISLEDLQKLDGKPLKIVKTKKLKFSDGSFRTSVVYTSSWLQDRWSIYHKKTDSYEPLGFVSVGEVTWETCAYVARYVQKKVFGGKSYLQDLYDCDPEFSIMSRRPGLGFYFPIDHPEVFDYNSLHVGSCPKDIPIPSRFLDLLIDDDHSSSFNTSRYLHLKQIRKEYSSDRLLTKLFQSDLGYIERLEMEENEKLQKASLLKRDLSE